MLLILSSVLLLSSVRAQTLTVSVPLSAPTAAPTLSPSLFSLSIEQDAWTDWAGTDSDNTYLVNVLDNLKERTGEPPWFRIGADSEDRTNFNPAVEFSQTVSSVASVATPYPEAAAVIVGEGFYQVAEHLPPGTNVVWGVNLREQNMTAAVLEAAAIKKAFDSEAMKQAHVTLKFIEIGNEPDLYVNDAGFSPANWTVATFVQSWTDFAANISQAGVVGADSSQPKFFGPSFAGVSHTATSFSPLGVFTQGILDTPQGSLLTTYSQHHYQCGAGEILTDIVVKANIRSNITQLLGDIALVKSHGLDYVLGETNSCFGHGAVNTSNVGGIAIWTLDYLFFAGQSGVSRAFFHQGIGYKYNMVQPVTLTRSPIDGSPLDPPLPPHVQPAYHAALVAAEAIGSSGSTSSVELDFDDDAVSGYAFYEDGALKRAVLINHNMFFAASGVARGVKTISLGNTTVGVKRLFIPSADSTSGLLWAGQSFDGPDGKADGKVVVESSNASAVALHDTEVVLVFF
ncbi:glycoside hydrolase family 79 protein [Roridomyces roridus]|uniref:Glycoside hydrolase family 79 protein n=1 Tax=Roridomyces roridus TaxID=1738132 RepID=A0AAD7CBI5_9AGAR|nr:glycoside hydrolase family 79 protein [Roridomyces roridus]